MWRTLRTCTTRRRAIVTTQKGTVDSQVIRALGSGSLLMTVRAKTVQVRLCMYLTTPVQQKRKNHNVCLAKRAPQTPPEITYQGVGVGKSEGNRGEIEGNRSRKKEIRVLAQCGALCFPT